MKILHNAEGKYAPSYFIISLDSDDPVASIPEKHPSTFAHEYIHFLQDLTLPYCIRENTIRLEEFFVLIDQAKTERKMRIPNNVTEDPTFYVTNRQNETTWGGEKFIKDGGCILGIKCAEEAFPEYGYSLYQYTLTLKDGENYQVGAWDLLEYIAHKIEDRHFPGGPALPDLPYRSLDMLLDYYRVTNLSTIQRVALAEYCLLNDNPIRRLMVVIEDIQRGSIADEVLASDDQFIEMLQHFHWVARGRPFETIGAKVERRLLALKESLLKKFPEAAFPAIYRWLDDATEYSLANLAGCQLFTQLYAAATSEFQERINKIRADIGIPLLANRNYEIGSYLGDEETTPQFIQLLLAYEFSSYVKRQDLMCPMYDVCEKNTPGITNGDCMDAPFRRANEEELCPFGTFIKAHGLENATWYLNGNVISGLKSGPWS